MSHDFRSPSCFGRRRGQILIYSLVLMPIAAGLCLLGADWGRSQLVKTELSRMCDSAARYAVTGLDDDTEVACANWVAGQNVVDGQPYAFAAADVQTGRWNGTTNTFSPTTVQPNAVRVTARRVVPAAAGGFLGASPMSVTVRATAKFDVLGFSLVGLDGITMSGNATASYTSTKGISNRTPYGNIGSNRNITLGGSSTISGNCYYGPGYSCTGGTVTGTKTTLSTPLSYADGDASPYGPSNNDNANVPASAMSSTSLRMVSGKSVVLPGGNYYFNDFDLASGADLSFTGPATIYCYGSVTLSGHAATSGSKAGNLKLVMVDNPYNGQPPGSVTVGSTAALYATVYAPKSAVVLSGSGDIYGSVIGKTVSMTGTSTIIYDVALETNGGNITLVE